MPAQKSDQMKIYIIVGLAVILLISAYFRFVHKKPAGGAGGPATSGTASTRHVAPKLELDIPQPAKDDRSALDELVGWVIRDIFSPIRSSTTSGVLSVSRKEPKQEEKQTSTLQLKGIILAGERPVARVG